VLNLTWNEIAFVAFLFLIVVVAGYLPRVANALGDFLHGYRTAGGGAQGAAGPLENKDKAAGPADPP